MSGAYYNEIDPKAAAWLRALIAAGHIADGDVDERSIREVRESDVRGYTQCHFFAGIGVWSAALRGAGWPDDRDVWTGSCPCQPFSGAGKKSGTDDERHLWPEFSRLIKECRPSVVFGEQVASPLGRAWLDTVFTDLEALDYACGAADLCAAGVGAPHIRQRLYFVADSANERHDPRWTSETGINGTARLELERLRGARELADTDDEGPQGRRCTELCECPGECVARSSSAYGRMGDASGARSGRNAGTVSCPKEEGASERCAARSVTDVSVAASNALGTNATNGFWRAADWLRCTDDKWRPVEPGTFPLAHGSAARVGRLRGYGIAVVKPLAEAFIGAYLDAVAC